MGIEDMKIEQEQDDFSPTPMGTSIGEMLVRDQVEVQNILDSMHLRPMQQIIQRER